MNKKAKIKILISLFSVQYIIFLTLVWRFENISHLGMCLLFGFAIYSLLMEKQADIVLKHDIISVLVSIGLIAGVLGYSMRYSGGDFLRLLPIVSGLSIGLLASGFSGLKQFKEELILLFILSVPSVLTALFIDISPLSAGAARLILLYSNFDVAGQGVNVELASGGIKVVYDCSGIDQMNYLFCLSILALVMFPLKSWPRKIIVPLAGLALGFFTNVFRLILMVIFASSNKRMFELWHTGEGSYFFALIAVILLILLYIFLKRGEEGEQLKKSSFS